MKSQLKMPAANLIASIYKFYFSGIPGLNSLSPQTPLGRFFENAGPAVVTTSTISRGSIPIGPWTVRTAGVEQNS